MRCICTSFIDSVQPIQFPDNITVLYRLSEPPTYDSDHLKMEVWLLSENACRVAARCIEDVTIYNYPAAKKSLLEPFMVDQLAETFHLQEQSRRRYREEVRRVISAVEDIERGNI